jgi:hypothetical protein
MRHGLLLMSLLVIGCAGETGDVSEEDSDEVVGTAEDAVVVLNAVVPNAVVPNAVVPNAVVPNALAPSALSPSSLSSSSMEALRAEGERGNLSRMHVKYLVYCAFTSSQSFSFSWTDSQGVVHNEAYSGSLGLASIWATAGIGNAEQRRVSACMGSLTNYFGISVLVSLRGSHAALAASQGEISSYPWQEGAFWGNIFKQSPELSACYNADNIAHSRSEDRVCAARLPDGTECGIIDVVGACSSHCEAAVGTGQYFPSCQGKDEVITTYLAN